jgi:hypothetical protein
VIANLDRDGNCLEATSTGKPGQRIVTTKPGDWLVCTDGMRRQVAGVKVWSESRPMTVVVALALALIFVKQPSPAGRYQLVVEPHQTGRTGGGPYLLDTVSGEYWHQIPTHPQELTIAPKTRSLVNSRRDFFVST